MSQVLTKPLLTDETGQDILDKLDEIISALSPNAQGVSFDKTGCQIITTNNVQDAVKQLDTGLDNTNASLTHLMLTDNEQTSASEISGYSTLSDITISTDGLYSFTTSFETAGGSNLIIILANKLGVEMYRQSVISAPRYSAIQTPILWLKAGTYKLRATGDLTKKVTYTYRV